MAGTYLPLDALLLATAVSLLVATPAVPVATAATVTADKYSGRMVIVRAPGATVVSAGGSLNNWQQQRRMVEDEVAPELGGLLGAGDPHISYRAFDPNKAICLKEHNCAAHGPYTGGKRPCASLYGCTNTPSAGHARAVHV